MNHGEKWSKYLISYTLDEKDKLSLKKLEKEFLDKYILLTKVRKVNLEKIHQLAFISMIGSSTRIENALLTDIEIQWIDTVLTQSPGQMSLIENKISKDKERSIEEVAGCRQLLLDIYSNFSRYIPITQLHLRDFHFILMAPYQQAGPFVGRYKGITNSVIETNKFTQSTRVIFKTADPGVITECAMKDLVDWYNKQEWGLEVICEFIYRFLAIHPFQDGNGHIGRALMLLLLLQSPHEYWSKVVPYLAIDRQIEKNKEEYYFVLNKCSNGIYRANRNDYKINYFFNFMVKILFNSLNDIDYYINKVHIQLALSLNCKKILDCFESNPQRRLSTKNIMELSLLPRRTIINNLNFLSHHGFIHKTGNGMATQYQLIF